MIETRGPSSSEPGSVQLLRREAMEAARRDAAERRDRGIDGETESRRRLGERARSVLDEDRAIRARTLAAELATLRETVEERLTRADLALDRLSRISGELLRLRMRVGERRERVARELKGGHDGGGGLGTGTYVGAMAFLGLVEFFANAPVFSHLMPRDPLTERQIQLVSETSSGWLAGAERVLAGLVLQPDAALLTAGVVTFLCVLAHFFGHSLQEWVVQRDRQVQRETVTPRSTTESLVPMALSGLGLLLVLGVLYQARVTLGEVGQTRYAEDMAAVEEVRRDAGWLRADGDLLAANELTDRADDVATAATKLRDYSVALSRLRVSILLLNLTLVLSAISAAYFHRRPRQGERFNDELFEEERRRLVDDGESLVERVAVALSEAGRELRRLGTGPAEVDPERTDREVRAALDAYRREFAHLTGLDPAAVRAVPVPASSDGASPARRGASEAERQALEERRSRLEERLREVRERFLAEATA